ncbi:MAG: type IV toxin-antitoxin system AbiEi family antitoxin domain-containing protein [Actinomycetes bacterium]
MFPRGRHRPVRTADAGEMTNLDAFTRAAAIAACQDGVITHQQVLESGISWSAMRSLLRSGRWLRISRGVYMVDVRLYDAVPRRGPSCGAAATWHTCGALGRNRRRGFGDCGHGWVAGQAGSPATDLSRSASRQ